MVCVREKLKRKRESLNESTFGIDPCPSQDELPGGHTLCRAQQLRPRESPSLGLSLLNTIDRSVNCYGSFQHQ